MSESDAGAGVLGFIETGLRLGSYSNDESCGLYEACCEALVMTNMGYTAGAASESNIPNDFVCEGDGRAFDKYDPGRRSKVKPGDFRVN